MPKAIKVISSLCIVLASIFIANMMFIFKIQETAKLAGLPLLGFINLFAVFVLVITTLVLLLRAARLIGFVRVLIYTLLLVLGLTVLLMFAYLTEPYAIFTALLSFISVVFLVGVRGYLNSENAVRYFTQNK